MYSVKCCITTIISITEKIITINYFSKIKDDCAIIMGKWTMKRASTI